ncbi:hypothetical protein EST38_g6773 [Candolleomyces aberdarensis]|uniref:Lariat debranching enzyme C-terminal domain-containing protein n=1 Tax=Candolleomyces aberdarensis TaxID=2316362 RepID=A0A4Q2DK61_9AGAR|nr:hypothetical protein EST38_g6773 [Candolleomyces aberdarensis]
MKIAVEGCCHGQLDAIYAQIAKLEAQNDYKVDLLLICGDFQAVRNWQDLACMAVPDKYKELADFHKYYTGERVAPILTIVIGGNHEASNYMWELYHGGWLAHNLYFLGHAGSVLVNGLKIAGVSGIFKGPDFRKGHHEKLPYDKSSMRSIYHVREYDIRRLSLLSSPHIFLSHDWPQSIEQHGDVRDLLRRKRFLEPDIRANKLGSPPLMGLLQNLKPQWWFAAHLHARYEATYVHPSTDPSHQGQAPPSQPVQNPDEILIEDDEEPTASEPPPTDPSNNPDEILLDDEEVEVEALPPATVAPALTQFLALDKCLPKRQFLEVIDVDVLSSNPTPVISFDPEWLAINRAFHPWFSTTAHQQTFPDEQEARTMVAKELEWVNTNVKTDENGVIPVEDWQTFAQTAPGPGSEGANKNRQPPAYANPQTVAFCKMLDIQDRINS